MKLQINLYLQDEFGFLRGGKLITCCPHKGVSEDLKGVYKESSLEGIYQHSLQVLIGSYVTP